MIQAALNKICTHTLPSPVIESFADNMNNHGFRLSLRAHNDYRTRCRFFLTLSRNCRGSASSSDSAIAIKWVWLDQAKWALFGIKDHVTY